MKIIIKAQLLKMRNLKNKMLRRRKKQEEIRRLERERLARTIAKNV